MQSFCFFLGLRLLPGTDGGSPARRGAWGERGRPLYSNAESVFFIGLYPARRVARGASARTFPASGRVMSAPAAALRPPCGRPGSPSRPRHRCISARGGRGKLCRAAAIARKSTCVALPEGSHSGKPAEGAALIRQRRGGRSTAEMEPGGGKGENVGQGDGEGQAGGAFSFFFY